ncbi:hypothetical protein XMIN_900 [Xanthomonas citri pv. mangiferaeindicae LMG 941]|nr:hypothetical protein XMIN_900 [Xanthomonas citri pv. mangiferaeindicae LMG 941]
MQGQSALRHDPAVIGAMCVGFTWDAGPVFVGQLSDIRGRRKRRGGCATLGAMSFPAGL